MIDDALKPAFCSPYPVRGVQGVESPAKGQTHAPRAQFGGHAERGLCRGGAEAEREWNPGTVLTLRIPVEVGH
jgi:hypothetical protein